MDRRIVFPGQLPLETDLLYTGQAAMVGLAQLSEAVLGRDPVANGFAATPTSPASLSINLAPGSVYQLAQLEATNFSSLPTDTRNIVKQGIQLDTINVPLSSPPTVGFAHNILIQVQYSDFDENSKSPRPFYNSANPQQPFSGPGNNDQPSPENRRGIVSILPKYGVPAVAGTQATPTPDPGWVPLHVITVQYAQTQVAGGNINPYFAAPTIIAKLPRLPQSIQKNEWTYFADTSATVNLITGSPTPALLQYQPSVELSVLVANTNTGPVQVNVSGLGTRLLTRRDGTDLQPGDIVRNSIIKISDDGTKFRLASLAQGEVARIVSNPVFYVRTDGSDDNDGSANTAAKAFRTVKGAILGGTNRLTLAGRTATIILGIPGTYEAPNFPGVYANAEASIQSSGTLLIQGNDIANGDTTPAKQRQYIIAGAGAPATSGVLHISYGAQVILRGLRVQNDGTGNTVHSITASTGSAVYVEYLSMGGSGTVNSHFYSADGAVLRIGPGCEIQCNASTVFFAQGGGITQIRQSAITLQGNLTFGIFAVAEQSGGRILTPGISGFTFTGTITGTRYQATMNGTIATFGGGANYFPGTTAGVVATGGQYA